MGKKEFSKDYFAKGQTETASRFDFIKQFVVIKLVCTGVYVWGMMSTTWHQSPFKTPFTHTARLQYGPLFGEMRVICKSELSQQIDQMRPGFKKNLADILTGKDFSKMAIFTDNPKGLNLGEMREVFCGEVFQHLKGGSLISVYQSTQAALGLLPGFGNWLGKELQRDVGWLLIIGMFFCGMLCVHFFLLFLGFCMLQVYWKTRPSPTIRIWGCRMIPAATYLVTVGHLAYIFLPVNSFTLAEKYTTIMTAGLYQFFTGGKMTNEAFFLDCGKAFLYVTTAILVDIFFSTWFVYSFPLHPKERKDEKLRGEDAQLDAMERAYDNAYQVDEAHDGDYFDDPLAEFENMQGDYGGATAHKHFNKKS
ncbi:unnamed protein product [Amoebophrya sp. A120]|nr:unnamed protein product [Amoebophrya sp. A120]|eukprot:GSA120T00000523001.1